MREDNGHMDSLKFEKNEKMPFWLWKSTIRQDPRRGRFDPDKDFKGEIYVDYQWNDGTRDKNVRITVCPYETPDTCVWKWGPTLTGDHWCNAVLQTAFIHDREIDNSHDPRCKINIARKDRK